MYTIATTPVLPKIEIYQVRMLTNKIKNYNQSIINYDPIIFNQIKRISNQASHLNELVRNSLPIMKLKTRYIINSTMYNSFAYHETNQYQKSLNELETIEFIDDLADLKDEIIKLKTPLRTTIDFLSVLELDEINQLKHHYYTQKKANLLISIENNNKKTAEFTQDMNIIIKAEEVILNYRLSDMFDKIFPEISVIESMDIPPSKKDLIKLAIDCAKRLLVIIDNGLDFMKLVDARLYLTDQLFVLREQAREYSERSNKLDYLLTLAGDVTKIEKNKNSIIENFQQLQSYLQQWIDYINHCLNEEIMDIHKAIKSCNTFMDFILETEYQYQRQLAD
ncbi:alpha-xenorhabdolysin family binary toxin subunit B [Providencia manganoxydans]|uniref:Alpha-xenorhabdolysin family binary toxin subunit B n=1 Tax=Providencia manganoxydans TaxID=2923283 RepID=A0ABX7AJF8_9GAMM|nr:alpha-xenorhabdolysin family binary toxin subunit B [Providencia manganoxydans]